MTCRIAVIGVGNAFRCDDGAGLEVAGRLRPLASADDGVRVVQHEGDQASLLDRWEGARSVVLVDAASSESPPGTIHRFEAADGPLPVRMFNSSTHLFGLAEAVELARALGRLPSALRVYAIEGADFSAGTSLTPAVEAAVESLVDELRPELAAAADTS